MPSGPAALPLIFYKAISSGNWSRVDVQFFSILDVALQLCVHWEGCWSALSISGVVDPLWHVGSLSYESLCDTVQAFHIILSTGFLCFFFHLLNVVPLVSSYLPLYFFVQLGVLLRYLLLSPGLGLCHLCFCSSPFLVDGVIRHPALVLLLGESLLLFTCGGECLFDHAPLLYCSSLHVCQCLETVLEL